MLPAKRPLFLLAAWISTSECTKRDLYEGFSADQGWHRTRRNAAQIVVGYGEYGHPFDGYESDPAQERMLQQETTNVSSSFDVSLGYPVKQPPASPTPLPTQQPSTPFPTIINYDPSIYEPLRINVDTRRLQRLVDDDPSKYYMINYLGEAAAKVAEFWSQHLSTIPVEDEIVVTPDECPLAFQNSNKNRHKYNDTDLVFYLFADEGPCEGETPPIAFSNECAMDQFDRPVAGWLLICTEFFSSISLDNEEGTSQRQQLDEVLQHELAHVLGMSGSTMPYWRDSLKGGKPRTPRPLAVEDVMCVNGTVIKTTMPSEDTVKVGMTKSGVRYFEVVTPTVKNVVANQFDCENATGARLDNFENFDCIGSHWSSRLFGSETMVSRNMPWEQSITAVTLALFEDTGWYKANFSASPGALSPPPFGYGAGCAFLTDDCILDDNIPDFGKDVFCKTPTTESPIRCDVSHRRMTKCDLIDYSTYADEPVYSYLNAPSAPGAEYQHFTNTGLGSLVRFDAEYCPTYAAPPYSFYDSSGVADGPRFIECSSNEINDEKYDFESYGSSESRCFNTAGDINRPLCLHVECILSGDLSVIVTVNNGEKVACEYDEQIISLASLNVQIECPRREVICPNYYCPANCSGRGLCRHGELYGCQCFDHQLGLSTDSPTCENSPIVRPSHMPVTSPQPSSDPSTARTNNPSSPPSSIPTEEEVKSNFPSIVAAIIAPTADATTKEDDLEADSSEIHLDSSCHKEFDTSSLFLSISAILALTIFNLLQ